ncbi:Flagellar assembly factor FliW [Paenibacillus sp. JJ-100]|uniref:flagellar assembly protein FliW n=1 Tax=Paenibacillus sp. JJ-100 TaxID=2974896 RepID=UPI0022FF9136|nr:flagellar assembly protein FliW [Paenibacillus sp. JJ-100]CAI6081267.1 Flagellar assembly factor FliW [Paenibacillus sp. JJ-100]
MKVHSVRFGEIEVAEDSVIEFVSAILGFQEETRYVLIPQIEESPFQYIQSITDPNLTFVLADPFLFCAEYEFNIDERWQKKLNLHSQEDVDIRVITTVRSSTDISINLKAPIVINKKSKKAMQIVLENMDYSTRYSLLNEQREAK